jgi:hypothetical protein
VRAPSLSWSRYFVAAGEADIALYSRLGDKASISPFGEVTADSFQSMNNFVSVIVLLAEEGMT